MSKLVDHLADLTGYRDRDLLDVTLVGAIKDLAQPLSVAIYRSVGESGSEHWLTRARLGLNDVAASADPAWVDVDSLPALSSYPHRLLAMATREVAQVSGTPHTTVFPLMSDREIRAVLEIESNGPLTSEQLKLVASILRIYRNFQSLLDYSERDTLTGLLNRKTFDEGFLKASSEVMAGTAVDNSRRSEAPTVSTWLGVIDIDHFKNVNDSYGHLIGDEVLLLLSRLMRATFRFQDRLYRFGGEEFVVLMRCHSEEDAAHAFERFRLNTESYAFPQVGRITVSIGFTLVHPGDTPNGAFERADRAVYHAKGHGRNSVHSHARLVALGELQDSAKTGDVELF